MNDGATQRDIGRIEGKLDALIATVREQGEQARESRRELYDRVRGIETSIEVSAKVDQEVRDRLDAFDAKVTEDVMPTITEVKRWKIAGMTVIGMAGVGGAAIASFALWAWDVIVSKIRGG